MKKLVAWAVLAVLSAVAPGQAQENDLALPTPREFYKTYDVDQQGLALFQAFFDTLDPQTRAIVMKMAQEATVKGPPDIPKEQVQAFVQASGWQKKKREILDQVLFRSQVFDLIPEGGEEFWLPIVHDALIYFLGNLSEQRLIELAWSLTKLPPDASRGEKILGLTNKIPTFQKIAQIIARNPAFPQDILDSLQVLENNVGTTGYDELISYIVEAVGEEALKEAEIEFDNKILAEGSIGAVIKVRCIPPGETEPVDAVIKMIKPYALTGMPEEMEIIGNMTEYFEARSDFYKIGDVPVTDISRDLRAALEKEIQSAQEQRNLKRAAAYYEDNPRVTVPWVLDLGVDNITVMEFIKGQKITDAFKGDPEKRAIMARRLYNVLTYDPIYSSKPVALFHGDPHAGNVFHVLDNPKDPYQIALLDWGLMGSFEKKQRKQLVQLLLGLEYKDPKRMTNNIGALVGVGLSEDPEKRRWLLEIFDSVFKMEGVQSSYEQLSEIMRLLVLEGYKIEQQLGIFIKSQLTIVGILAELDPNLDQMKYAKKKIKNQVAKEIPLRILLLPAWNYHGYKSMMSNEDVKDSVFK